MNEFLSINKYLILPKNTGFDKIFIYYQSVYFCEVYHDILSTVP